MAEKKILVRDPHGAERIYTQAVHGFDFHLDAGEVKEVNEEEMKILKKTSNFLQFESPQPSGKTVFGAAVKVKKGKK